MTLCRPFEGWYWLQSSQSRFGPWFWYQWSGCCFEIPQIFRFRRVARNSAASTWSPSTNFPITLGLTWNEAVFDLTEMEPSDVCLLDAQLTTEPA
jgi:hypothetical protein